MKVVAILDEHRLQTRHRNGLRVVTWQDKDNPENHHVGLEYSWYRFQSVDGWVSHHQSLIECEDYHEACCLHNKFIQASLQNHDEDGMFAQLMFNAGMTPGDAYALHEEYWRTMAWKPKVKSKSIATSRESDAMLADLGL